MNRKRIITFLFIIFCFLTSIRGVNAICGDKELQELKDLASHIEYSLELNPTKFDSNIYDYYINLYNFSNKFYLISDKVGYVISKDKKGNSNYIMEKATFMSEHTKSIFEIYSSSKTKCPDYYLGSFEIETPTFNDFSLKKECKENPEFEMCMEHYETKDISDTQFNKEYKKYIDEINRRNNIFYRILDFITTNYIYIIAFVGVALVIAAIVIIINKRRSKYV